jgi:hypothetical protein
MEVCVDQFRTFVDRKLYRIRGFMHPSDAIAFSAIMAFQAEQGWRGAHAEIGVFYGRSLSLMALDASRRGSKVLGIDLFDIPGQQDYVRQRLGALGLDAVVDLHAGSSLDLTAAQVLERCGPVRLFSVDGGHELVHIESDAELAAASLSAEGVIAFDDFMNAQYPDLSRGIIRFLEDNADRVVPFAITPAKLYACPPAAYEAYRTMMERLEPWAGARLDRFRFMDREVVFLDQPLVARALYQKLAERGLGWLGDKLAPAPTRRFARQ